MAKEWIRTGKQIQDHFNNVLDEMTDGEISLSGLADAVESIAQDRAVTLLSEHFGITTELANEIYYKHYPNE